MPPEPSQPLSQPPLARRTGPRVTIITCVHSPFDIRIFQRQARTLAAAGYQVLLIAPDVRQRLAEGVQFSSLPSYRQRWLRPLRWPLLLAKALRSRADIYHFHDPEILPWGLLLKLITAKAVIYDSHEFLAESIRTKLWLPAFLRPVLAWTAERVEKAVAARLSAVVSASEEMAAGFRRWQPRAIALRNYPLMEHFDGASGPEPRRRQPIAIYVGSISKNRGLEMMLEAAPLIKAHHPQAQVQLLGPIDWTGVEHQPDGGSAGRLAERGIDYLGEVAPPEVPAYLRRAAVGWIPLLPTPHYVRALPTKLFEYMAAGLPVVASDFGLMGKLVRDTGCGLTARAGDPRDHAEKIVYLLSHPQEAREMGERGFRAFRETYNWDAEKEKLLTLYRELVGEGRS